MMAFVDQHRDAFGVEPICRVLQIAPLGYRRYAARQRTPALHCQRARRDESLVPHIERVWRANMQVYGADKVWRQLHREGHVVARCTVERLMRRHGLRGVIRGKVVRTTISHLPDGAVSAGQSESAVQSRQAGPTVGLGLHLCLDQARLAVRGLRYRCLCPPDRGLAGEQFDAYRFRARRARAGALCLSTGPR